MFDQLIVGVPCDKIKHQQFDAQLIDDGGDVYVCTGNALLANYFEDVYSANPSKIYKICRRCDDSDDDSECVLVEEHDLQCLRDVAANNEKNRDLKRWSDEIMCLVNEVEYALKEFGKSHMLFYVESV